MKPRDIFLKALRREPTPRPAAGSATSVVTVDLMDRVGAAFPEAHLDAVKMADLAAAGATVLGFDNVMPLFSVWHESAALGCKVSWGARDRMPDSHDAPWKFGAEPAVPRDFLSRPECRVPLEALTLLKSRLGGEFAVMGKVFGPWTLGYHLYGVENFLMATLDYPDAVRRAMDRLKEVTVAFALAQIEAGADALCLADHATRDLCSPEAYREFLLPVHRELARRIPCPVALHICGDTADRIPFIRETGLACFHFDSKVPAAAARELAGRRLALMGGTSNLAVVRSGTAEQVRADVLAKKAAGIDIIGPECAVPLDAPFRNMVALTDEVRRPG
ncbi:MAG TPA: uroporphyrinogen decarboxylase family protein [Planctomycetota bacterium]|nr:uroporphyrinogen decarboxylase family protein [Planctomycetota bacterium]